MSGRKHMAGRKELTQSLKNTGMMNYQESKKLNCSVDKYKKEFEKKLRELSVQQSMLVASQRKRESRRGSLPSSPSIEAYAEEDKRNVGDDTLKSSFSDSALDQYTVAKDLKSGVNNDNKTSSSPSPLKLPNITTHKNKGSRKIELEDVKSIKTPKEILFDKLKYSRQAKPRLDALDVTSKLSNGYSAMVIASPPIARSTRRGSLQPMHLSPLTVEEAVPKSSRLMRRGSCPSLGSKWARVRKLVGVESNDDNSEEQKFSKHVEEMKKCRYLRFPTSIREDEEENIDSVFIQK
ncbi:hypothetical protein ACROYT_G003136 [Oculina patagonica]